MKIPRCIKTDLSIIEYKEKLYQAGYHKLDCGIYADVFTKGGSRPHVIKIGEMYQDGYLDYLRQITPSNPFFPKVYSIACFSFRDKEDPHKSHNYYAVKMEHLEKFYKVDPESRWNIFDNLGLNDISDLEVHGIDELHGNLKERKVKNPNWFQMIRTLKKLYRRCDSDLHDGNVMWRIRKRGVPQLVITDPVC